MKSLRITIAVMLAILAVSVASIKAQVLDLSGGTIVASLTNQELIGSAPPHIGENFGSVSSWVVSDSSLDSSGYIFIYQVLNQSPDTMNGVTFDGFAPPSIVIGTGSYSNIIGSLSLPYALPASTQGSFTYQSTSPDGAATFQNGNLPNGSTPSWFLVVDTDVNSIQDNFATTQNMDTSFGNILAPASVPEPSSSLILLGGLASLCLLVRARRSAL